MSHVLTRTHTLRLDSVFTKIKRMFLHIKVLRVGINDKGFSVMSRLQAAFQGPAAGTSGSEPQVVFLGPLSVLQSGRDPVQEPAVGSPGKFHRQPLSWSFHVPPFNELGMWQRETDMGFEVQ